MSDSSKRDTRNPRATKVPTTRKVAMGHTTTASRNTPTMNTMTAKARITVRKSIRRLVNLGIRISKLNVYVQVDVKV